MAPGKVTVFGGTGFLGQHVVRCLLERDFSVRVAVRHPERIAALFPALHLDTIQADVNDDRSVAAALAGVEGVVNAVSLYAETGSETFHSVHVEAATRVARLARQAGVGRFIHVSGIGADAESASPYIRSRGKGEKAVREAFSAATLIRPSVMFGRGDAFLIPIARMLRRLPVFPLFGHGQTQLQPAYVEDVADAIARVMQNAQFPMCYELGGPRVYAYRSLLEVIARLPEAQEDAHPSFEHHGKESLPLIESDGVSVRLILGRAYGETAPARVFSETFYADADLKPGSLLPLPDDHEDRGVYLVEGSISVAGQSFEPGRMMVFRPGDHISVAAGPAGARLIILGGATLGGPRYIWWNFVASSRDRIEAAKEQWRKADWSRGLFDLPPDDRDEFTPLPPTRPIADH
jgi:uncharacterized protein YbjT (DUF2867 family)